MVCCFMRGKVVCITSYVGGLFPPRLLINEVILLFASTYASFAFGSSVVSVIASISFDSFASLSASSFPVCSQWCLSPGTVHSSSRFDVFLQARIMLDDVCVLFRSSCTPPKVHYAKVLRERLPSSNLAHATFFSPNVLCVIFFMQPFM